MAVTEAQRRAIAKWQREKVDEIRFRVPKGEKEIVQVHAEKHGESVNAFLRRAVTETIARDEERMQEE